MSKGFSPLVAVVLLIAVTMSITGIILLWSSSFVQTQTTSFQNTTLVGECKFATFEIDSCVYNFTSTDLTLSLNNNGQVDLKDLVFYVEYPDGTLDSVNSSENLPHNSLRKFFFSGVEANFSKIIVRTHCPQLSRETVCK